MLDILKKRLDLMLVSKILTNQKIFSFELGYGYRSEKLRANLNIYSTRWNDRTNSDNFTEDGIDYFVNLTGVNALHQGVEVDFNYRAADNFTLTGMFSAGNWEWTNNIEDAQVFDDANNPVGDPINLLIKGLKVADAAQTTAALGFDYEMMPKTHFTVDFNYFGNLYADFDPNDRGVANASDLTGDVIQSWKAPDYTTFDASLRYGFDLGSFDATLTGRMNNIFDTEYIADARDGSGHDASSALVYYGFGRTFNFSLKLKF